MAAPPRVRAITYTVADEAVPELEELIRAVFTALAAAGSTLPYAATRVVDTGTFTHVIDASAGRELESLPEFAAFQEHLRRHMLQGPTPREIAVVGMNGGRPVG